MLPFLVTWDGVNNSSFISITDPASVLMGYSDAFILPSGNLICFGHSTTNAGLLRLAEYTPSLTLVRSMPLITMSNLLTGAGRATVKIRVKKTSYGYIVAAQHNDAATGVDLAVMTLDSTCTSVISSRTGRVQNAAAEAGTVMQSVIGEKGAMLMQRLGTKFGSANYFVNSNGVINTSVANQYVFNSQTFPTSSEMGVASLYEQSGCTVFADGNAPSFYVASNNIYSGYAFLTGGAAGNESQTPATYVDIQTEPMINKYTTQSQDIYPASIDRTVNGVYSAYAAGWTGTQMCYDQNGFIWWNYGDSAAEKGKFFKREYR
jgi:hypothetical protein